MIIPVLLASDEDTRLWPLSRRSFPKQFSALLGDQSPFQETAKRFSHNDFMKPVVVTRNDYRFIAVEQLEQASVGLGPVLIEPTPSGTAACVLAAAVAHSATPDALLLITPCDLVIDDMFAFLNEVTAARGLAEAGKTVSFNTSENHPTGIFFARVNTVLNNFEEMLPDQTDAGHKAVRQATRDMYFTRVEPEAWKHAAAGPIEDVFSQASRPITCDVPIIRLDSWQVLAATKNSDQDCNVISESSQAFGCQEAVLHTHDPSVKLVGVGLDGITAVVTSDAVLVADRRHPEQLELALEQLRFDNTPQFERQKKQIRPWGHFETLSLGDRFQVKSIMVKPGAALSLQSHMHRSEHWVVVEGSAQVTVDDRHELISENGSIYIPLGAVHRLENPGKLPLHLIEVQSGCYLGEDDIVRYEDLYKREIKETAA